MSKTEAMTAVMIEIPPETKQTYREVVISIKEGGWVGSTPWKVVAALRWAVALAMQQAFELEGHTETQRGNPCWNFETSEVCVDPRHDFVTHSQWLDAAHEALMKEG